METLKFEELTYKFDLIDIAGEEEWASWCRQQAMTEAEEFSRDWPQPTRIPFLAEVSKGASLANCGFTAEFGLQNLQTKAGQAKVLELAARKPHGAPYPPYEIMQRIVNATDEATILRICGLVIPVSEEARQKFLGELEKKVSGRKDAGPS